MRRGEPTPPLLNSPVMIHFFLTRFAEPGSEDRDLPLSEVMHVRGYRSHTWPVIYLVCQGCESEFSIDTRTVALPVKPGRDDQLEARCILCVQIGDPPRPNPLRLVDLTAADDDEPSEAA